MTRTLAKTLMALGFVSIGSNALAQAYNDPLPPEGWSICIDFTQANWYSPDFLVYSRATNLFRCSIGNGGTVRYFGQNSPCGAPSRTYNTVGRIGFAAGPVGSIQDDNSATGAIDNDMQYTFGMPNEPAGDWGCAYTVRLDPTSAAGTAPTFSRFGAAPTGSSFEGFGGHYIHEQDPV